MIQCAGVQSTGSPPLAGSQKDGAPGGPLAGKAWFLLQNRAAGSMLVKGEAVTLLLPT